MFAPAEYCCPLPLPLPLPHSKIPTTPKSQQTIQPTTVFSLSPRSPRNPTIAELVLGNQTSDPQDQSQLVRQPRRVSAIRSTRKSHPRDLRGLQIVIQWLQYLDCEQRMI